MLHDRFRQLLIRRAIRYHRGLWDTRKKDFFFEKKKQKTFAHFALYVWQHTFCDFNGKKFFGSFFQKRTLLLSSRATYLNASLVVQKKVYPQISQIKQIKQMAAPPRDLKACRREADKMIPVAHSKSLKENKENLCNLWIKFLFTAPGKRRTSSSHCFNGPVMSSGRTHASNCSAVRNPSASAASFSPVPSRCAFSAICADFS